MSVVVILACLALLIWGAWRGHSVLLLAPGLAVLAAALSGAPALASYTQVFMQATGGFIVSFFPLFLLGAVFGRIMEDSGAAEALARAIARAVGARNAILAVVLACAALTYGGVSLFVVAFAAWPLARALFRETGLPARLIPATIALGAFTFTMTALPGTPQIQNAIPMPYFGTTAFAAPGLGLIAAAVMLGLGLAWLNRRAARLAAGTAPDPDTGTEAERREDLPPLGAAAVPVAAVVALTYLFGTHVLPRVDAAYLAEPGWGGTDLSRVIGLWSVLSALVAASLLALVLNRGHIAAPGKTLSKGAEAALLPVFNTASLVGFGAVVAASPGFAAIRDALDSMAGGNLALSLAVAGGTLAAVTGSASGGMSIALDMLGADFLARARVEGVDPALLHRVVAVATGGLDTLPHNGAVVTLLGICGMTHRQAYGDIFVVSVAIPLVAAAAIIALGTAFGAF
jgi:H+/gluconate symporter-like permease